MPKFQFWLAPTTKLTRIQRRAIDSREPIFLSGVTRTGKTLISIYRLKKIKNSILFTYGKLLKKTIEEKLNDKSYPVDNIHHWMWNKQNGYKQELETITDNDSNIASTVEMLQSQGVKYDEILVDEGQDLSIGTYKILSQLTQKLSISADNAQRINNRKEATTEDEIQKLFPNLKKFELDVVIRSAYELYNFAIQFVPYNARAHDTTLLERLKRKNSGADKPFVYIEPNLNGMFETVRDIINENRTDNIGILFEKILNVDEFTRELSKDYEVSSYHSLLKSVPDELKNIIITTFKSAKGIEFDIVIIPYFPQYAKNVAEEYYVGATRAKNELHFLSIGKIAEIIKDFDPDTYKLVDNRS